MSFIKKWFTKSEVEVPDLDKIEIAPEIVIPEKTQRELYDSAVAEVQMLRVKELILRSLADLAGDDSYKDTKAAIEYNGGRRLPDDDSARTHLLNMFQSINVIYSDQICPRPEPTLDDLATALAKVYMETTE